LVIIGAYKKNPWCFTKEARKIIKSLMDPRWSDFDEVTARLNAPELIDFYERKRFRYRLNRRKSGAELETPSRWVFTHNEGDCWSITYFTIDCLRKGGYKAKGIRVPSPNFPTEGHVVTLFEMNGKKYVMDNGAPRPRGIMPYEVITHLRYKPMDLFNYRH
jgi:hypothetical protein